jgi:exopolysaccharide production protein ExoZ
MKRKINNIQALRAFAAVAVVIFHTEYSLFGLRPFGSFGVAVFFVISGFIMAGIIETNRDAFFLRRLVRILPPYWIATLLLFVFACLYPALLQATKPSAVELLKSLFFIPYTKSNGLLRPMLFVGWSLNYEMFFYVVLALCLWLMPRRPTILAAAVILAVTFACRPFMVRSVYARFYGDIMQFDFVLGMIAFYLCRAIPEQTAQRLRALTLTGMLGSMLYLIWYQGMATMSHLTTAITYAGMSFLMVVSADLTSKGGWDTDTRWIVLTGDASYILYLIHPYVEIALDHAFAHRIPALGNKHAPGFVLAVVLSVAVAIVIHLKLERPTVNYLNRLVKKNSAPVQISIPA